MVANLPTVVQELKTYKTTFNNQLPEDERERHESIFKDLMDAYEEWSTLAKPRVKVPFHHIKQREFGVHKTNMQEMLEELRLCNI